VGRIGDFENLATQIVSLTRGGVGGYLSGVMKFFFLPVISIAALSLTSCGLLRTATQVPLRTLQSASRTIGVGSEISEVKEGEKPVFEIKADGEER